MTDTSYVQLLRPGGINFNGLVVLCGDSVKTSVLMVNVECKSFSHLKLEYTAQENKEKEKKKNLPILFDRITVRT